MLDFFSIFSKGGIVLWCFQGTNQLFTPAVNSLIKSVILQERTGNNSFSYDSLTLKYKLDNEFELIFVVAYQNILQLSYVDKLLTDIQLEFRDRYKTSLLNLQQSCFKMNCADFEPVFRQRLREREEETKAEKATRTMRTFETSQKSKKTVASMIENKNDGKKAGTGKGKENKAPKPSALPVPKASSPPTAPSPISDPPMSGESEGLDEETLMRNRMKLFNKGKKSAKSPGKSPDVPKKKGKTATVWADSASKADLASLDRSGTNADDAIIPSTAEKALVGKMSGQLQDLDTDEEEFDDDDDDEIVTTAKPAGKSSGGGMFSMFKNLVGSKSLTAEDLTPALDKMRDHLISKNVAADIAIKLCESVSAKLEGKVLGTFGSIASTVRSTLHESCVQILSPRRRVDILRDAFDAKQKKRPYVITFCGVNGVGKSTNLAKVCFWLVENGLSVLIAAGDTFRSGAVEQLRTHVRKLNALHPEKRHDRDMVQLYDRGYGKDPAGIAMEAISSARDYHIDVVLVDTAGRMQDNEPLMRALSKLVKVNAPDLVLFVGEALVGNEAVDQLAKFNQALADFSQSTEPRLIDGIILTKFDTIDDKVGAAISMTYTTGQPIVFVGTGQTYSDLRNLNAKAVVNSLLR